MSTFSNLHSAYAKTLLIASLLLEICVADGQNITATWAGGTGNWNDGSYWTTNPNFPNNGVQLYSADIYSGSATLDQAIDLETLTLGLMPDGTFPTVDLGSNSMTVKTFDLKQGRVTGSGTLSVSGAFEWNNGLMLGAGTTNALNGIFFNGLSSSSWFGRLDRTLNCYGSSSVQTTAPYTEDLDFDQQAALNIMPGATFNGSRLMILGSDVFGITNGTVTNYGTLVIDDPGLNRGMDVFGTAFVNQGEIQITNSSLDVRTTTDQAAFIQNSGNIRLLNGKLWLSGFARLNAGSLSGNGTVGNLQSSALIAPTGTGLDFLQSTLTLLPGSVLAYDFIQPTSKSVSCPQITNVYAATLEGTLQVTLNAALPHRIRPSSTFTLLSAQMIAGQFSNVASGQRLTTSDERGSFLVTYNGTTVQLSDFRRSKNKRPR